MEDPKRLASIEDRVQFNYHTRDDALYLLETIRELRKALVKAAIPLEALNMVYHDKDDFHPDIKAAIHDGVMALRGAVMDTEGITMWHTGPDGRKYGVRGE